MCGREGYNQSMQRTALPPPLTDRRPVVVDMKKRTPQEKKMLSYERDRRNVYGRSPHASRKAIPLNKALRNRANRHFENQHVDYHGPVPGEDLTDELESLLLKRAPKEWEKYPDAPLGEVIAKKSKDRAVMRKHGGRRALITIQTPKKQED